MKSTDLWTPRPVEPGRCYHWQIGPLDLWIEHSGGEWRIASATAGEDGRVGVAELAEKPPDIEWRRWSADVDAPQVALMPVFPDRSVIVRPDEKLSIMPKNEALFFVSVPVWIRVLVGKKEPVALCEEPSVVLSKSWFGTPTEGESCYALRTAAQRVVDDLPCEPHRAVCPVRIRNGWSESLLFERFCLRVRHLAIFAGAEHMWATQCNVKYHGGGAKSGIVYGKNAPDFDRADKAVGEARQPAGKGFFLRTFDSSADAFSPG